MSLNQVKLVDFEMNNAKLTLVSGGSGSGKSLYAESLVLQSDCSQRVYLATMRVWDEECRRRVERHRAMRSTKDFRTIEQPVDLTDVRVPENSVVLMEDLSNLVANECYGGCGFAAAEERIMEGVDKLCQNASEIIIVTNELFSDGVEYDPSTAAYLALLARLNRAIAQRAQQVVEVVAGIPIFWKGTNK